jgi:prophage antirepressor-like protein
MIDNTIITHAFEPTNTIIRALEIDGDPWFVAKDVAETLGYADTDYAIRAHCRAATTHRISPGKHRGNPNVTIIPERDVYRLIMRSRLPQAEAFEDWVVGTVLPSIRKHGGYVKGQDELSEDLTALLHKLVQEYALPITHYIDNKTEWSIDKKWNITEDERKRIMQNIIEQAAEKFDLPVSIVKKIAPGGM